MVRWRLEEYKRSQVMEQPLEYQFYLSMVVQIRNFEGADKKELQKILKKALLLTVPEEAVQKAKSILLSVEEMNLLLEYAFYSGKEFSFTWYENLLSYVEKLELDNLAMAKIYPKVVLYACLRRKEEGAVEREEISKLLCLCDKAIEILQKGNRMFFLWELLHIKEHLLQSLILDNLSKDEMETAQLKELRQKCINWRTALDAVYEKQGISKEMRDFCYIYIDREVHCIGDVIRIRRKMLGMTMLELSDGICSERTVSRLERNITEPRRDIVRELFERLNMASEFCRKDLITENPEAIRIFGEAKKKSNKRKCREVELLLEQVKSLISLEIPENKQAVQRVEAINEWNRKRINKEKLNRNSFVERIKEILNYTISYEKAVAPGEKYLTQNELHCLQNIMNGVDWTYPEMEQCVITLYELFEKQRCLTECFDMYEFAMGAVASNLGNRGEYDRSDQISLNILKNGLYYRRVGRLYKEIYAMLWNAVQREKEQHPDVQGVVNKKELLICIYLCEMSGDMHQIPFLEKALREGIT